MVSGEVVKKEMSSILEKIAESKGVDKSEIFAYFVIIKEKNSFGIKTNSMKVLIAHKANKFSPFYTKVSDWVDAIIAVPVRNTVKSIMSVYATFNNQHYNTKLVTQDVQISAQSCEKELVLLHALYKKNETEKLNLIEKIDVTEMFG